MSKLKLPIVYFETLCLKAHGQIVGAVSKVNVGIYIAFSLLIVSSMLLLLLTFGIKNDPNLNITSERQAEVQAPETVQVQPAVIVTPSQAVTEAAVKKIRIEDASDGAAMTKLAKSSITLDFGWQLHPVYNEWRYHTGIDISGSSGQLVEAIYNGHVIDIYRDGHSGLTAVVKNNTYVVYYGSLSEVIVSKDSDVKPGQSIGIMGSSNGEPYDHLHLAIKKGESYIDPKLIIHKD